MKNLLKFKFILLGALLCLFIKSDAMAFSGGSGTVSSPYIVSSQSDLIEIGKSTTNLSKHYALGRNISLSSSMMPIGYITSSSRSPFTGSLDGKGYKISNLDIYSSGNDGVGLFYRLEKGATVKNLILNGATIEGGTGVGAIAGESYSANIINCAIIDSTITGTDYVGGLIGSARGRSGYSYIENCTVAPDTEISDDTTGEGFGGLIGHIDASTSDGGYSIQIYESSFLGVIDIQNGSRYIGGFVGSTDMSDITNLYIRDSYASNVLTSDSEASYVAGFIGYVASTDDDINIDFCYYGGEHYDQPNQYSLIYRNRGSLEYCYFSEQLTDESSPSNSARSTNAMKEESTYSYWEFGSVWEIDDEYSMPRLMNNILTPSLSKPTLTAPTKTDRTITLKWNSISQADYYKIKYGTKTVFVEGTTTTITGLTKGTSYKFTIMAANLTEYSDWSSTLSVTTNYLPVSAISNFRTTAQTADSVTLAWTADANATSYDIAYGSTVLNVTGTSRTITGLQPRTAYLFKIRGKNPSSTGAYTPEISVTTKSLPLTAPTNIELVSKSTNEISLKWDAVLYADVYEVVYNGKTVETTDPFIEVTGLTRETAYLFKVRAKNLEYVSDFSAELAVTTEAEALGIPQDITITGVTQDSISLTWSAVENATSYIVTYNGTEIEATTNTVVLSNLKTETDYVISIKSINQYDESETSEALTVRTTEVDQTQLPIIGLKDLERTDNSIELTWNVFEGAVGYEVIYYNIMTSVSSNEFLLEDLASGTYFTFRVRANLGNGRHSQWSQELTTRTFTEGSTGDEELIINAQLSKTYEIAYNCDENDSFENLIFTIKYNPDVLEIIDYAAQTPKIDMSEGLIEGTDIEIISNENGILKFKFNKAIPQDNTWSGVMTIVKFTAIRTQSTDLIFSH
jgi:chitodextrinase